MKQEDLAPPRFSVVRDPMVPVRWADGAEGPPQVSAAEALRDAHRITAIHDDSPLISVALLRFLLALLYAACAPRTAAEWKQMWEAETLPFDRVDAYLNEQERKGNFDLFSAPRPFYQMAGLTMKKPDGLARLATEAASGNNATLFDHRSDAAPKAYTPAEAARLLLAAQSFALGFGKAADAVVDGVTVPRPYSADAPILRGMTVYLTGDTLKETLLLNLVPLEYLLNGEEPDEEDRPCWERHDPHEWMDRVDGKARGTEPGRGVLDRLTWQSRLIRLQPEAGLDGATVVRLAFFTQGRSTDRSPGDPMKSYRKSPEEGYSPLSLAAEKAAWRDIHALLQVESDAFKPAAALRFVSWLVNRKDLPRGAEARINVVGLATDPGKAGKFLLWRHDRVSVPAALLDDPKLVGRLSAAVAEAEDRQGDYKAGIPDGVARQLYQRTRALCRYYLAPDCDAPDARQPDPKDVGALLQRLDPRPEYWARLEGHFYHLLAGLGDPERVAGAEATWRRDVEREAARAMREAARSLGHTGGCGAAQRVIRALARVPADFICGPARLAERRDRRERVRTLAEIVAAEDGDVPADNAATVAAPEEETVNV